MKKEKKTENYVLFSLHLFSFISFFKEKTQFFLTSVLLLLHLVIGPIICPVICPVISFDYPSCYLVLPSRVWHSSFIMLSEGGLQCKFIRTICYLTWKWQTVIKLKKSERPPLKSSMKAMIGCQPWQIFFFSLLDFPRSCIILGKMRMLIL